MGADQTAETLHAAIDEDPAQAANYLVLADHLLGLDDPRGELIGLSDKTDKSSRQRRAVLENELGPDLGVELDWRYGFVHTWRTNADADEARQLRKHLDHPSLRHLTTLELTLIGSNLDRRQWLVDLIAEKVRPALRSLTILGNKPELTDLSLAKLWTKLPRIESLRVNARLVTLGKIRSATLVALHIDAGIEDADLRPLLTAELPALRELSFEAGDDSTLAKLRKTPLGKRLGTRLAVRRLDTDRYDRFVE